MKISHALLVCLAFMCACKKTAKPDPVPQQQTGSETPCVPMTPYSGMLVTCNLGNVYAEFYDQPINGCINGNKISVSGVTVNGDTLHEIAWPFGPPYFPDYEISTGNDYTHDVWTVTGDNGIPSFVYTNTDSFPVISHHITGVESVYKNDGFTFTVNASHFTEASVDIQSGGNTVASFNLTPGANLITLSPEFLSGQPDGYLTIFINSRSRTFPVIAGMTFRVEKVWYDLQYISLY